MRCLFIFILLLTSCNSPYSGGNIGSICELETNIKLKIIKQLSDSLFKDGKYIIPLELDKSLNIIDYSFLDYKTYYFDDDPRQIFMITFDGLLLVRMVYDVKSEEWITKENHLDIKEIEMMKKRFYFNVLEDIKKKANLLEMPDSIVFREKLN